MNIPTISFFNNNGAGGATSFVYHLSWMYARLGLRVLAADLDPQANLTSLFLDESRLEQLWLPGNQPDTIYGSLLPLIENTGDVAHPSVEYVGEVPGQLTSFEDNSIGLLVGDLRLSLFQDTFSDAWHQCMDENERAYHITSAFWRVMHHAAKDYQADIILMDVGPNLGAINRAALIAADYVIVPLSPDIFSLQGLLNVGPTRQLWHREWQKRLEKKPATMKVELPPGQMQPVGYIVQQHPIRLDRPAQKQDYWLAKIPAEYSNRVLNQPLQSKMSVTADHHCLALLKYYSGLTSIAQEAHKPMFNLKPADGVAGSYMTAVLDARRDFEKLARIIAERTGVKIPQ